MQKMIEFHHNKGFDMLKLGRTLTNLAIVCLHKSTDSKFYAFTESGKNLFEKIREDMVRAPSVVFTRKAVVNEAFVRKSSNLCKTIVGIDANQLHPYSMCQPMPTGLYSRWEYDSATNRFTAHQNESRSYENMGLSYFQGSRPDCTIESNVTTGWQKKIDCFSVDGVCYHCNTVFEAMRCCYHYCPCQEARPFLTDTDIERGVKKRQQDVMRREYIQQEGYQIVEMWECEWWSLYKTDASVKIHLKKTFRSDLHWVKKDLCKDLSMGDVLVIFNVILKCLNTWVTAFPIFIIYSKILLWVRMILVIWWNSTQKRKILCFSLKECSNQALF